MADIIEDLVGSGIRLSPHQLARRALVLSLIECSDLPRTTRHPHVAGKSCLCGTSEWAFLRFIKADGDAVAVYACVTCGAGGTGSHAVRKSYIDPTGLPIVNDNRKDRCEVCGALGVQVHHWAPRHLFGNQADVWPTSKLCVDHHAYWHSKVTPGMAEKRAA